MDFGKNKKMNILAPAGNYEKLVAAVKAGANEVFFGLKRICSGSIYINCNLSAGRVLIAFLLN